MADLTPVPTTTSVPTPPAAPDPTRISLIKGGQRWQFRWERGEEAAVINAVAAMARDPQVDFDWFDAAVICRHIARFSRQSSDGQASNALPAIAPNEN